MHISPNPECKQKLLDCMLPNDIISSSSRLWSKFGNRSKYLTMGEQRWLDRNFTIFFNSFMLNFAVFIWGNRWKNDCLYSRLINCIYSIASFPHENTYLCILRCMNQANRAQQVFSRNHENLVLAWCEFQIDVVGGAMSHFCSKPIWKLVFGILPIWEQEFISIEPPHDQIWNVFIEWSFKFYFRAELP